MGKSHSLAKVFATILYCILCTISSVSQEWADVFMNLSDDSQESFSEDEFAQLESLYYAKLNLNQLTAEDCSQLTFLTEFEKQSLLYYISKNAPLLSIYELQLALGIPIEKLRLLSFFCYVGSAIPPQNFSELIANGRHQISLNSSFQAVNSADYKELNKYQGNPNKQIFRYRFSSFNQLFWGITLKKDMGEQFTPQNGFDSKSMYLQIKNRKHLENFIIGDYKVSIGQGLALAQNGFYGNGIDQAGGVQSYVLNKSTSSAEFQFSRGLGATFAFGKFRITPFFSLRQLDGKLAADSSDFTIYKTGYHRTESEQKNKQQLEHQLIGLHSSLQLQRLKINLAILQHTLAIDDTQKFVRNANVSYQYLRRHVRLYGELATDQNLHFATIQGVQYLPIDEFMLSSSIRAYHSEYESFMSAAEGRLSEVANEYGWRTNLRFSLGQHYSLVIDNNVFEFPKARTIVKVPSVGNVLRCKFQYSTFSGMQAYYQYSFTTQTSKLESIFGQEQRHAHTLFASVPITESVQIKASVRISGRKTNHGFLAYADAVWKPRKQFTFSCRLAQFNAQKQHYLYAWEDDVLYSFSSSQYLYAGNYCYAIAKWQPLKRLNVQAKVAHTRYSSENELPKHYELFPNRHKLIFNTLVQVEL